MKKITILLFSVCLISAVVLIQGCKKATLPTVTTSEISGITINSAVSGGEITSDGDDAILEKGVCWNTTGEPTIADVKTSNGKGSASFISTLTGLQTANTYSVRAYGTNSVGTSYGEEFTFTTKIADIDGNQYSIVMIGSQTWMAENLKTTKYNDNTQIPNVTDNLAWSNRTTHAFSWYNNDEAYSKPLYGALYNWYAVESGKLCPTGWHVPTDAEYNMMEQSIGLPQAEAYLTEWRGTDQGAKMKNTTGWSSGENGTNTSGFSALPGGYRGHTTGTFNGLNILSYWWTGSNEGAGLAWYRRLDGTSSGIYRANTSMSAGKYIRCVKD